MHFYPPPIRFAQMIHPIVQDNLQVSLVWMENDPFLVFQGLIPWLCLCSNCDCQRVELLVPQCFGLFNLGFPLYHCHWCQGVSDLTMVGFWSFTEGLWVALCTKRYLGQVALCTKLYPGQVALSTKRY